MSAEPTHCRSCGALVLIRANVSTGKPAPINAEPAPGGNIAIDETHYWIVPVAERAGLDRTDLRFSHFATCPDAKGWRR